LKTPHFNIICRGSSNGADAAKETIRATLWLAGILSAEIFSMERNQTIKSPHQIAVLIKPVYNRIPFKCPGLTLKSAIK
jgi:hypothetical protein